MRYVALFQLANQELFRLLDQREQEKIEREWLEGSRRGRATPLSLSHSLVRAMEGYKRKHQPFAGSAPARPYLMVILYRVINGCSSGRRAAGVACCCVMVDTPLFGGHRRVQYQQHCWTNTLLLPDPPFSRSCVARCRASPDYCLSSLST